MSPRTETQTDTQTGVTTIHFSWSTTHAKCNKSSAVAEMGNSDHNRHGAAVPLLRFPSNTMWPGSRSTSVPSGIFIHPAISPQQIWAENWGLRPLLGEGAGSPSNTMSIGLRPTSLPSDMLIHPAIWPQQIWTENWGLSPFGEGGAGSPSSTKWPGPRPTSMPSGILIHPAVKATIDICRKLGLRPLLGRGSWVPI